MACSKYSGTITTVVIIVVVAALIIAIGILSTTWQGISYYQFGLKKTKSTGVVDRSKVYGPGLYSLGPDAEFVLFDADAHYIKFDRVTVAAADRLQVMITAHMQYFIRSHQLAYLHKTYGPEYEEAMKGNALDALKGAAPAYQTRVYLRQRELVERGLFSAVRERLGGKCCERNCIESKAGNANNVTMPRFCVPDCKPYSECDEEDFGLFVDLRYFQLVGLDLPDNLQNKFLNQLIEMEKSDKSLYTQDAEMVRKDTEKMAKVIENEAFEISQNATAHANRIRAYAYANETAILEDAKIQGLRHMYTELGLTSPQHKSSLDYLRTLRKKNNVHLTFDYQTYVAGPMQ